MEDMRRPEAKVFLEPAESMTYRATPVPELVGRQIGRDVARLGTL